MKEILFLSLLHLGDDHTEIVDGYWEKKQFKTYKSDLHPVQTYYLF